ncbi:2-haloacid dehalogenase [Panacagrimonas perspica]|uniref:(S)-2-haloacid dehalogenase n=1 Tax=Panacagrimonas perspica TaxID=381431 RepID=A0A4S3JZ78_9GAMM|nr:haloacid dehalogenase type II [Panacagrimonas perspica]TDU28516.1 2-haloacid dehalogenase [Panacagrimonas perspica]THD00912.1 haloacid dehalogenase, type II [Panacagrimonas perspica]
MPLHDIDACVFDAYGTLLDFNSAAAQAADVLGDRAAPLSELWRAKQVQYTWLRSLMDAYVPFWQVTGEALDFALDTLGIRTPGLRDRLMGLYRELAPFPDVVDTLTKLRGKGLRTAILTNGSQEMIDAGCRHAGIASLFDAILSVEDVGIYKPHPRVYQLAVDRLGVAAERIAFISSNGWDAAGAAQFGFQVVWCNRYAQRAERLPTPPAVEITTLRELALP